MDIKLSRNFTLGELTSSPTATQRGIRNVPGTQEVVNLTALCVSVLQPLRDWWGKEVPVSSGYRCAALNRAVGGVSNSQHVKGQAADLFINGDLEKGKKWFGYIRDFLDFDQLIWEHDGRGTYWVHVSYVAQGCNRRQVIYGLLKG
jgi:hypothetical protein